ncbi:MAG: hypothetical protein ABI367_14440 [Mucilaginibacter sp.]
MKKYLVLLTIIIVFLGGCKLDEAGFPIAGSSLLIGKWYNKSTTTYTPPQNGGVVSFTINNNYTTSDYLLFDVGTVTASIIGLPTNTYKYVYQGSTLTLTSNVDPTNIETSTVQKLTADSLVLVSTATITINGAITLSTVTDHYAHK